MAEARPGVVPLLAQGIHTYRIDPATHKLQSSIDRNGIMIFIPGPRFLFRNSLRAVWRLRNNARQAYYPLPLWVVVLCNAVAAWQVAKRPAEVIKSTRLAQALWKIDSFLPWTRLFPEKYRVAYLTFNTAAVVIFGFTALHRQILKRVLTYTGWVFEARVKKSWKTKVWGFLLKYVYMRGVAAGKRPDAQMLAYQNCLPTLPVPSLEASTSTYMRSVLPLLPSTEYAEMEGHLKNFLSNEGPKLQRYLRLKHAYAVNYVSDWWLDFVYLRGRDSLTINSNYWCAGRDHAGTKRQASRAAKLVQLLVEAKLELDHERLPPQMLSGGLVPMCMKQITHTFSTTREPHRVQDRIVQYDSTTSRHVVVLNRGRIYTMDCFSKNSRRPLTAKQLESCLIGILEDESPLDPLEASVPVLTSLDRDTWSDIREKGFLQVQGNNTALETIEKALFVLCLDDVSAPNFREEVLNLAIGDFGKNRWVDKSFHIIVAKNAKVGIEAEHAWGDAPALGLIWELVLAREIRDKPYDEKGFVKAVERDVKKVTLGKDKSYPAQRLRIIINPFLRESIEKAIPTVRAELSDLDYDFLDIQTYGRDFFRRCKYGADPAIQMALQLAYFRDQGHFDQTYESCMTRLFKHGRTETIRSVSVESCAFVRAMNDPSVPLQSKIDLFRKATDSHNYYSSQALVGQGCDRHLFALYVVSVGTKTPSVFLQKSLGRKWKLSTSQVPQRQTPQGTWPDDDTGDQYPILSGGFGPVADDGYGVCYCLLGENRVIFHVTSKFSAPNTSTARFVKHMEQALSDIRALFPDVPLTKPKDEKKRT